MPEDLFSVLLINHDTFAPVIAHRLIRAVTTTGTGTGSGGPSTHVGALATQNLKKKVREIAFYNALIVFEDADLELAIETTSKAWLFNDRQRHSTCLSYAR
ncbi:MAG: aldehyde dehydrogenase family protein [Pseudomonadota bacterium]